MIQQPSTTRSSYVDSADGKTPVETVSIKELIPHLDGGTKGALET